MHHSRSTGILFAVAVLIVSLAAPAAAKKGGNPGPPSGSGLEVTVEPSSGFMWANSAGDQILFDITVTNMSGGDLEDVAVYFSGALLDDTFNLGRNASWVWQYTYEVVEGDFEDVPISEQTTVTVGTVTAGFDDGTVLDSDDAVMAAYPVIPCDQDEAGDSFTFTPTEDYSVCSFTGSGIWKLTTTLDRPPRGKSNPAPAATVRDGVPGNWCATGQSDVVDNTVIDYQLLNGICEGGGAGGDTITVRNTTKFYLANWQGNTVDAEPLNP